MNSSKIPELIQATEPVVFVGSGRPFRPLRPMGAGRTQTENGWLAFQLIQQAHHLALAGSKCSLCYNRKMAGWMIDVGEAIGDWERVTFDGYGSVASWGEVDL